MRVCMLLLLLLFSLPGKGQQKAVLCTELCNENFILHWWLIFAEAQNFVSRGPLSLASEVNLTTGMERVAVGIKANQFSALLENFNLVLIQFSPRFSLGVRYTLLYGWKDTKRLRKLAKEIRVDKVSEATLQHNFRPQGCCCMAGVTAHSTRTRLALFAYGSALLRSVPGSNMLLPSQKKKKCTAIFRNLVVNFLSHSFQGP